MKNIFNSRIFLILIASIVLSLGIITWKTVDNIHPCQVTAGCVPEGTLVGNATTKKFGYPLAYRQINSFEPTSPNAGYAVTSIENEKFNLLNALLNVLFWYGLLSLISNAYFARKK